MLLENKGIIVLFFNYLASNATSKIASFIACGGPLRLTVTSTLDLNEPLQPENESILCDEPDAQ